MERASQWQLKAAFILGALLFAFATSTFAAVTKLSFVSEPAIADPGAITSVITIQSQDESGESVAAGETTDLSLVSSSPTGEFSSSAASWKSVTTLTMSSNSANRNFYYRDSTAGVHTITINAAGRVSLTQTTASTKVYIGSDAATDAPVVEDDASDESDTTSFATGSATSNSRIREAKFEVSGGTARNGFVRTPIHFRATTDAAKEVIEAGISYQWSFGDGSIEEGASVVHAYDYPGEYVAVLNAYALGRNVSHRVPVIIYEPKLEIVSFNDGVIEIANKDKVDANINFWQLSNGRQRFQFPRDTIVPAGKRLMLSSRISKLRVSDGALVSLSDPDGMAYIKKDFSPISTLSTSPQSLTPITLSLADEISASSVIARTGATPVTQFSYALSDSAPPVLSKPDSAWSNTGVDRVVQNASGVKGSTGGLVEGSNSAPRAASENTMTASGRGTISQTGAAIGSASPESGSGDSSKPTEVIGDNISIQKQSAGTRFVLWLRGLLSGK